MKSSGKAERRKKKKKRAPLPVSRSPVYTLGVETSCDETSCAVIKNGTEILSNVVSSSLFRHKKFGGVVPEIASRHSMEQIRCVFHEALEEAKIKASDLDLIAVTQGPGLIGSLFVGVSFAKALAYELEIPLVGVNHMEAHLVSNFFEKPAPKRYVGLLVSGGHTMITFCHHQTIKVLGETIDDAVGEAYDKVAKILGLGYPGGPVIDALSKKGNPRAVLFTRPKLQGRFETSFSGIKTAVLYLVKDPKTGRPKAHAPLKEDIAASFQHAVIGWLIDKVLDASEDRGVSDIVVGGGVSANSYLRKKLGWEAGARGYQVWFPPISLSTDNGAMIAKRGYELYKKGIRSTLNMTGDPALTINKGNG